ncbi:MAG TPA: ABC transporter permease [Stellaceae bacterium]|nr:ABC transporter permease [Stellaceae bacterium]
MTPALFRRGALPWTALALLALTLGMPLLAPLFAAVFPDLPRPLYRLDPFWLLALSHLAIVAGASTIAALFGVAAGIFVTRPAGAEFRRTVETIAAIGQAFPPVAVLAIAVPIVGFGAEPALVALSLYGLLPIVENTIAGLDGVPTNVRDAARGSGMTEPQILRRVDLPLAAPVILAGIRTAAVINVGTAAIASTVGARTLGSPIIIGLNANNLAYVIQGAVLTGLLAVTLDLAFERLVAHTQQWRRA